MGAKKPTDLVQLRQKHQCAEAKADGNVWVTCYGSLWSNIEALKGKLQKDEMTNAEVLAALADISKKDGDLWDARRRDVHLLRLKHARERKAIRKTQAK